MIFRQLFEPASGTYSYVLASGRGGEPLIIDPVLESMTFCGVPKTDGPDGASGRDRCCHRFCRPGHRFVRAPHRRSCSPRRLRSRWSRQPPLPSIGDAPRVPQCDHSDGKTRWLKPRNIFLWRRAKKELARAVGDRQPGCTTLDLCAFAQPGRNAVPIAQIRKSNEIFQGISVVKDPDHLREDIYYQAQMASLAEKSVGGRVARGRSLRPAERQALSKRSSK